MRLVVEVVGGGRAERGRGGAPPFYPPCSPRLQEQGRVLAGRGGGRVMGIIPRNEARMAGQTNEFHEWADGQGVGGRWANFEHDNTTSAVYIPPTSTTTTIGRHTGTASHILQ